MTDDKAQPAEAKSIPRWAKILASFSAAVILLGLAGGTWFVVWFRKASIDSLDPVYMADTLKLIGDFPLQSVADAKSAQAELSAVSGGYAPVFAFRVVGLTGLSFSQGKDKQQFVIFSYRGDDSDPDRRDVIDLWYEKPAVFFADWGAKYISVADKSKVDINGRQFDYQTGLLKDLKGVSHKSLIGCLNHGPKVVVVEAVAAPDQALNVEDVVTFLRKAQSF